MSLQRTLGKREMTIAEVVRLIDLVNYQEGSVISRTLGNCVTGKVTLLRWVNAAIRIFIRHAVLAAEHFARQNVNCEISDSKALQRNLGVINSNSARMVIRFRHA